MNAGNSALPQAIVPVGPPARQHRIEYTRAPAAGVIRHAIWSGVFCEAFTISAMLPTDVPAVSSCRVNTKSMPLPVALMLGAKNSISTGVPANDTLGAVTTTVAVPAVVPVG